MEAVCQLCGSRETIYRFKVRNFDLISCRKCNLMFLWPQPTAEDLQQFHEQEKQQNAVQIENPIVRALREETAGNCLSEFLSIAGSGPRKILAVGSLAEEFAVLVREKGMEAITMPCWTTGKISGDPFDGCVLFDTLETAADINQLAREVKHILSPDGILFLVTPSLDSLSSRRWKSAWIEFRPDHLFYFDTQNLECFLLKSGFGRILTFPEHKIRNFRFAAEQGRTWGATATSTVCRKADLSQKRQKLSVIVPVFNEKATFGKMMEALYRKQLSVPREIIIVESNSTDGTREEVQKYERCRDVKVILEEKPLGKGHAVRAGLAEATGDIILIQDADLEYDIDDYDNLLEPLLNYQRMFVLGSRHTGNWKIRKFESKTIVAAYVNLGHILLTYIINRLHKAQLKDPFTMYKVFRRDCLYGLTLESNGFDLDWELVIKLLRKNYFPLEVPVNYRSRSFREGKKIHLLKDPLRGLRALVKYRFSKFQILPESPLRDPET